MGDLKILIPVLQFLDMRLKGLATQGTGKARTDALKALEKLSDDLASASFKTGARVALDNQALGQALIGIYSQPSENRFNEVRDQVDRAASANILRRLIKPR